MKKHKWIIDSISSDGYWANCVIGEEDGKRILRPFDVYLLEEHLNLFEYLSPIEVEGLKARMDAANRELHGEAE